MRRRGRERPNSWLYLTDPRFENVTEVPPQAIMGAYQVDEHGEVLPEFHANENYRPEPALAGDTDRDEHLRHVTSLPLELTVRFDQDSTFIRNELVVQLNETARNLAATAIGRRQANLDFPEVAVVGHGHSYDSVSGAQTESVGATLAMQIAYHLGAMQSMLPADDRITVEDLAIDGLVDPHVPAGSVHVLVDYRAGNSGTQVGTLVEPRKRR